MSWMLWWQITTWMILITVLAMAIIVTVKGDKK